MGGRSGDVPSVLEGIDFQSAKGLDFVLVNIRLRTSGSFEDLIDIRGVSADAIGRSIVGVTRFPTLPLGSLDQVRVVDEDLSWASHAGMYAVLFDSNWGQAEMTSAINRFFDNHPNENSITRLWISLALPEWEKWDLVRRNTGHRGRLSVCLRLTDANSLNGSVFERWLGEPVAAFELNSEILGSPTGRAFALRLVQINAQPIVSDTSVTRTLYECLEECPPLTWEESYTAPYYDSLQLPLQPLADNMDNVIYETFEADMTKYDLYEEAISQALQDYRQNWPETTAIRIAIAGAGRGGLINATLRAISRLNDDTIKFNVIGVEKNPNAVRTLRYKARDDPLWTTDPRTCIEIVHSDMRSWNPDPLIDILVSELLGSFGDNEASPECIYGAWHCLNPTRGICIPRKYTSYLEPVSCARTWTVARDTNKLEYILVSALHNCYRPSQPLAIFQFVHEINTEPMKGDLSGDFSWEIRDQPSTIHGFEGYFNCELYKSISLSIEPSTKSKSMVSWFPAFLPLQEPVLVKPGEKITLRVDRRSDAKNLWFQWTLLGPISQSTNNPNGRRYTIGLS